MDSKKPPPGTRLQKRAAGRELTKTERDTLPLRALERFCVLRGKSLDDFGLPPPPARTGYAAEHLSRYTLDEADRDRDSYERGLRGDAAANPPGNPPAWRIYLLWTAAIRNTKREARDHYRALAGAAPPAPAGPPPAKRDRKTVAASPRATPPRVYVLEAAPGTGKSHLCRALIAYARSARGRLPGTPLADTPSGPATRHLQVAKTIHLHFGLRVSHGNGGGALHGATSRGRKELLACCDALFFDEGSVAARGALSAASATVCDATGYAAAVAPPFAGKPTFISVD